MKRFFSALLICLLLLPCVTAFASSGAGEGTLPFELKAPSAAAQWLEERDSPTTMALSYSIDNTITDFFSLYNQAAADGKTEVFMSEYPFDDIRIFAQIDWALDDTNDPVSGWHYNEFWEGRNEYGVGCDANWNRRVSEWDEVECALNNAAETVQNVWIMRGVPNDTRWNGDPATSTPGVKDQLNPDQYEYYDDNVHIDFTQHTAYFRVRLVAVTRSNSADVPDTYYYSNWSATCAAGRDTIKFEPIKPGEIAAPVITDLRMTEETFDNNPVIAYTLTLSDDLQKRLVEVFAVEGTIYIETYARIVGDSDWIELDGDRAIKAGESTWKLAYLANDQRPHIDPHTEIELHCRYRCDQPEMEPIYSDWSESIVFTTENINNIPPAVEITRSPKDGSSSSNASNKQECAICHFCPHPLGLCIFIWLLIILAIAIPVVILLVKKKNNKR